MAVWTCNLTPPCPPPTPNLLGGCTRRMWYKGQAQAFVSCAMVGVSSSSCNHLGSSHDDMTGVLRLVELLRRRRPLTPCVTAPCLCPPTHLCTPCPAGLYVVTAAHNNARSAMIASWVSQASFEPLGLTIAVAKDRAIESLMQVGVSTGLGPSQQGCVRHHMTVT